jgi:hypothetical protein
MIMAYIIFGLVAAGLGIGLVAAAKAPLGYQDESGFHYGYEQDAPVEQISCRMPEPKLA